jgi:outer membrane lipoprotein SlyB
MSVSYPKTIFLVFMMIISLSLLAACMPESRSGAVYSRDQARTSHSVYYGTILRVEEVTIEGTQSGLGTIAGGAMGAALGSAVGGGSGQTIATVGGAIAGGAAGSAIEKNVTTLAGYELEVELDNGEIIVVVQEQDSAYHVGDRVRVVKDSRGTTRIRQ